MRMLIALPVIEWMVAKWISRGQYKISVPAIANTDPSNWMTQWRVRFVFVEWKYDQVFDKYIVRIASAISNWY